MRKFTKFSAMVLAQVFAVTAFTQSCPNNLLTNSAGYYGGFEAGSSNISASGGATDYKLGMPRNGNYEIVSRPSNAGGGGYLSLSPKSGQFLMVSHTRSAKNERIWYKTISVTPGDTYNFCAWIANIKQDPVNGFTISLKVNNTVIASKTAVYGWSQICGSYTVPAGQTSIVISILDPNAHVGPSHFLGLDDICFTKQSPTLCLGNLVWNDRNGNGLKDADEPGIPNVPVDLFTDSNDDNIPDGGPAIATTTTDANGNYLFCSLNPGRYITCIPILPGYGPSPNTALVAPQNTDPDFNVDNDNNAIIQRGNKLFTPSIELSFNNEPTDDGDGPNSNLTLDMALCGNTNIGDFVWNDLNDNGIQDYNEPGLENVKVTLQFSNGTIATSFTNAHGFYEFPSLGPGVYPLSFETPVGFVPAKSNMGGDDGKDSDPVNGVVDVTVAPNNPAGTPDYKYDAGFYCPPSPRGIANNNIVTQFNGFAVKKVFPNPFVSNVIVNYQSGAAQVVTVRVVDNMGRLLYNKIVPVVMGENNLQLNDLGRIATGNYTLQIIADKITTTNKLIKK